MTKNCWQSLFGGSCDIVNSIFAHKGGEYNDFGQMLLHGPVIIQDARPKIIDAPLAFIARMGQAGCRLPFYQ